MLSSKFKFYIFILVIIFFIIVVQYKAWFSATGYYKYQQLTKTIQTMSKNVDDLKDNNKKLYAEVVSLQKNNVVLDSLARENLGLIKKNETFYMIKNV